MTKQEFFKYCDQSSEKYPLHLSISHVHREAERALFLCGHWHRGSVIDIMLYRPTPGRQWEQPGHYSAANAKCEEVRKKYQRWLQEWSAQTGTKIRS